MQVAGRTSLSEIEPARPPRSVTFELPYEHTRGFVTEDPFVVVFGALSGCFTSALVVLSLFEWSSGYRAPLCSLALQLLGTAASVSAVGRLVRRLWKLESVVQGAVADAWYEQFDAQAGERERRIRSTCDHGAARRSAVPARSPRCRR